MAKKSKKKSKKVAPTKRKSKRVPWTKAMLAELRRYSKEKLPVAKICRRMKRTPGAIRQKGLILGIPLGHRR